MSTIDLSDEMAAAAERTAAIRGFDSTEAFVEHAVRRSIATDTRAHAGVYDDDRAAIMTLVNLIERDISTTVAADYFFVECYGYSQPEWADLRGVDLSAVSHNRHTVADELGLDIPEGEWTSTE